MDDNHLYAILPDDGNSDGDVATKWTYLTGNDVLSSPVVDQNN